MSVENSPHSLHLHSPHSPQALPREVKFRDVSIFDGMSEAHLDALEALATTHALPAGTRILERGKQSPFLYIVASGTVRIYVKRAHVGDVVLAVCGMGEVLGELSIIDGLGHSASAVTLEPSVFYRLDRDAFAQCLKTMPALAFNVACNVARRLRIASLQIHALSRQDVYGRLASQLLAYADQYGIPLAATTNPSPVHISAQSTLEPLAPDADALRNAATDGEVTIPLRLTQTDLADLIGASRVRVNQVFNAFKRSRYISVDRHFYVTIHNRHALVQRCGPPTPRDPIAPGNAIARRTPVPKLG